MKDANIVIYVIVLVAHFAMSLASVVSMAGISVQYTPLASYDFLSASELHNFMNITLDGKIWNVTLTKYSVSNGILNITNKDIIYRDEENGLKIEHRFLES